MKKWVAKCPSCERTVESRVLDGSYVVVEHGECAPVKVQQVKPAPLTLAEAHALARGLKEPGV